MFSISKKVFGLAGVATVFAGMAFGQATCGSPTAAPAIIRAEGTAEQLPTLAFTCTAPSSGSFAAGTASLQLFISPALPVTSKVTTSPATEARLTMSGTAGATAVYYGSVSGSTVSFSGIILPLPTASQTFIFTIDGIRVNATSLAVGTGIPPTVSISPYITGSVGAITTTAVGSTAVAFAQNGLASTLIYPTFNTVGSAAVATAAGTLNNFPTGTASGTKNTANNFVICATVKPSAATALAAGVTPAAVTPVTTLVSYSSAAGLAFVAQIGENFTSAFKTPAGESTPVTTLVNGTRLTLNFTNVPAGVTLYVPNAAIMSQASAGSTIRLAPWAIGTDPSVTPAVGGATSGSAFITGTGGATNSLVAVSGNTATFEVITADANSLDTFNVPVYIVTSANGTTASAAGIGVSVSFAPTGATTVPNFIVGGSTNVVTASSFNTCTTSLLFPFVTNQLGFDTGIAIANTSTDPFASTLKGGAVAQAGTCALNFYGSGAPTPANATTPNVPTGTVYTQVLSGVAAGFQGYIIAQCNFQYAHGFAFITNGVGVNGGLSQGYLAGVILDTNQVSRSTATGETLGN